MISLSAPMTEVQLLELRQRIKIKYRDTLKKQPVASVCEGHQKSEQLPSSDTYGSFFGQSQPSIARRLLQDSNTMVEVQQLATKLMMNSHHNSKQSNVSTASKAKPGLQGCKITAQELKTLRDYSYIFSDMVENLVSSMEKGGKKNPGSSVQRVSFANSIKMEQIIEREKTLEPKMAKLKTNQLLFPKNKAAEEQHSMSMPKLQEINKGRLAQNRKYTEACNVEVMQKQVKTDTRHYASETHRASFLRSSNGGKRKHEEEIEIFESKKAKVMQKQPQSSVKVMFNPTKGEVISSQATKSLSKYQIKQPTHELPYDDEVEDSYISSLCHSLFRRNHTKHIENNDYDADAECMVSNFNDIQNEERKSAKIARKEDQLEQLRLEQEEKEERLRRKAKKQKQQHD